MMMTMIVTMTAMVLDLLGLHLLGLMNFLGTALPSPSMSDNETERTAAAREKVAIAEKVKFSENLNKLFKS